MKHVILKSVLFSLPTSIFIGLTTSGDAMYKYKEKYGVWPDDNGTSVFTITTLLAIILLSIPIAIALYKDKENKGWIIALSLLSFLPFGTIMYAASLLWAIFSPKHVEKEAEKEIKNEE